MAVIPADEIFEFVALRRAQVARTQALFGLDETWTGQIEDRGPFNPAQSVLATVTVADMNRHAVANVDALVDRKDGEVIEHQETLVVVPRNRLPICTPRRISPLLASIAQLARRYIVEGVKREGLLDEPANVAFGIPQPEHDAGLNHAVLSLRMMLIRAILRWLTERDLAGYGPRWREVPVRSKPAA
jgi:hypothetical protein